MEEPDREAEMKLKEHGYLQGGIRILIMDRKKMQLRQS